LWKAEAKSEITVLNLEPEFSPVYQDIRSADKPGVQIGSPSHILLYR